MAISSYSRSGATELWSLHRLASRLSRVVAGRHVPVLAVRLPDLERTAWKRGRSAARRLERRAARAFVGAAARVLRGADVLAHDDQSEVFLAALFDRARERGAVPSPTDCRSALNRLAAALSDATGLHVETGWTVVETLGEDDGLMPTIARALERGARERERYDFFSAIGHELRTPLTSIRGYLETLLDDDLPPDVARRFVEIAHAESLRLARLLDGMFEISLFDMRALRRSDESCEVGAVVERAVEVLRPQAQGRGTQVSIRAVSAWVLVEGDHLTQMLVNLIENAIKHGRDGGRIVVETVREDERFVAIIVDDDGPGVAATERDAIFALSHRGTTAADGSGIGLAFVRLMAERIGGDVSVADSPLGGARFVLRLPLRPV